MKQLQWSHIALLLGLMVFVSCSPRTIYYSPGTQADVGLEQRNDLTTTVSLMIPDMEDDRSLRNGIKELDLEIAWSPIEHLGIYYKTWGYKEFHTKNYYTGIFNSTLVDEKDFHLSQRMHEYGIGGYKKLSDNFRLEGYAFLGKGNMIMNHSTIQHMYYDINKKGLRLAATIILPNTDVETSDIFRGIELGGAFSRSSFRFDNLQTNFTEELQTEVSPIRNNPNQQMGQFALYGKLMFKHFNLKAEMGLHSSLSHPNFSQNEHYISGGLTFNLDDIFREF